MSKELIRIFKYQALGNSYLILDPLYEMPSALLEASSWGPSRPRSELVRILCDVSNGVGSNGLLFGPLRSLAPDRYQLVIINSDGTSAGFSGNGTRIFAKYLMDANVVSPGQMIEIEIPEENLNQSVTWNVARIQLPLEPAGQIAVTAPHMPRFGIEAVRAAPNMCSELTKANDRISVPSYTFPSLSVIGSQVYGSPTAWSNSILLEIGNPHCVTFVNQAHYMPTLEILRAHDVSLKQIAFRDQLSASLFANGVNLQWAWPESRKRLKLVIYERGEGPTLASGSSACAAACAAFSLGLIENKVDVVMPGGTLAVHLQGTTTKINAVTLLGNACRILDGSVSVSLEPPPNKSS